MDISKETKSTLLTKLEAANTTLASAQMEAVQANAVAQKAIQIANDFSFNLFTIESLLANSPIGKGKFVKTLWFFITNWKQVVLLIEGIIEQIRIYKDKVRELQEAAKAAQTTPQ